MKITILLGQYAKEWFSKKMEKNLEKSERIKVDLDQRMQMSASRLSQKTRGMKEAMSCPCCSTHFEAKEQVEAFRPARPSQETPREETGMEFDHAQLLAEFDAVCAWTPRDTVIIERMITYGARDRKNVFVEVEELETHILISTGAEGIIDVSAWSACDHGGRRRCVAIKETKETTLVANLKQCAFMRAMQDEEYQELHQSIGHMNEMQGKFLAMMERKQNLMSGAPDGGSSGKDIPGDQGLG